MVGRRPGRRRCWLCCSGGTFCVTAAAGPSARMIFDIPELAIRMNDHRHLAVHLNLERLKATREPRSVHPVLAIFPGGVRARVQQPRPSVLWGVIVVGSAWRCGAAPIVRSSSPRSIRFPPSSGPVISRIRPCEHRWPLFAIGSASAMQKRSRSVLNLVDGGLLILARRAKWARYRP